MRPVATIPMLALCVSTSCVLRPPSLSARAPSFVASAGSLPPPASEPASAPEGVPEGQVIEAGCSFTGVDIKGEPGSLHQVVCPAGCDKETYVIGTDVYKGNSSVCVAAMHAGAIPASGGQATVMLESGRPAYRGSKRNGIMTHDDGAWRASFRFEGVPTAPPPAPVAKAPVLVEAGCTFESKDLKGDPGTVFRVTCPAGCNANKPMIWGSDPYSGHSSVCVAAIHAGLATDDAGGAFMLTIDEGKPAYRGSKRNGVESHDRDADYASFRLRR